MTPIEIVRRFTELAWQQGDLEAAEQLLAEDLVDHDAMPFDGRKPGREGLLQVVAMVRAGLPDLTRTIEEEFSEGDRVVTAFTDRATHSGELFGTPATGRRVVVRGINIVRVRDGRIAEIRHVEDMLSLMTQLGARAA
jgi:steroid delta-isomerase-like uncharacterized protein